MGPKISLVVASIIKAAFKKPQIIPHLLAVVFSFVCNYFVMNLARLRNGHRKSVAVALIEHMGDIVAAEPISRFARSQHPDSVISWIVRRPYRDVVTNFSSIDKLVTVRCMTEWLLLWSTRPSDLVWDLHISERPCLKCGIAFHKPGPPGQITYQTYYNHGSLLTVNCLSAGIPPINGTPEITPDNAAVQAVNGLALPDHFVAIHCKSNEDSRDWQAEKWRDLVAWITSQTDFSVCEIGSKPHAIQHDDVKLRNLCGSLGIMETAEVIRRASLFIGIDSGPAHLANATGTPGVIVIGRYQGFQSYMPYSGGYADGTRADLVHSNGPAQDVPLDPVIERVRNRLRPRQTGQADTTACSRVE